MKRIYRPTVQEGFEWVQPRNERDFDRVYKLDGTSRAGDWTPVDVQRVSADESREPMHADLPWLGGHALVLRKRAYDVIRDVLSDDGEFLELRVIDEDEPLWLFNVCVMIDALDAERSELTLFPSSGRVMRVERHVFRPERLVGRRAFRIPQARSLFLNGEVVEAISAANLTGPRFDLVWSSD